MEQAAKKETDEIMARDTTLTNAGSTRDALTNYAYRWRQIYQSIKNAQLGTDDIATEPDIGAWGRALGPNGWAYDLAALAAAAAARYNGAKAAPGGVLNGPALGPGRPTLVPTNMTPLQRPYLRVETVRTILNNARKTADGRYVDAETSRPIDGPFDIGHTAGRESWRLITEGMERGMTQAQFNDWVNGHPEWFQLQAPGPNRSHQFEMPP
jgi:hypothetical protein